jgi:hypothetical protein
LYALAAPKPLWWSETKSSHNQLQSRMQGPGTHSLGDRMAHARRTIGLLSLIIIGLSGCGVDPVALPPPVISPNGGTFTSIQTVTISDVNPAAVIHYTVDDTVPSMSSPTYSGAFQVANSLRVKATAFISSSVHSTSAAAAFVLNLPAASVPVIKPVYGSASYGPQIVTITDATPAATIYYTTNGTTANTSSTKYTGSFTITSSSTIRAVAIARGYSLSAGAVSAITVFPPLAATPAISPAGGTFARAQTVTITDVTAGASIYFTVNGSTPTAASTRYTAPFLLGTSSTVKAIAIANGYSNSSVAQAAFTITGALSGVVKLRNNAVVGAAVNIYTAGKTGSASSPTPVSPPAYADATGRFNLAFSCGNASDQAFAVSEGGTPAGGSAPVDHLLLVTALGPCGSVGSTVTLNEFTTVAAAYALAQFSDTYAGSAYAHIGAPSTNARGIADAFLTANAIANPTTGLPGGPNLSGTSILPLAELNSLANAVATCGGITGTTPCQPLLDATTSPSAGGHSTDSFTAMVNLAQRPAYNPNAIYVLSLGGVFTGLGAAPTDWTLAITHKGGGINRPTALGIDATGNVWIANYAGSLTHLTAQGTAVSPAAGYTGGGMSELNGLTIDISGNVWVTSKESAASVNGGKGAVQKWSSAGVLLSGATGFASGINFPEYAAADALGNIWIANSGNSTIAQLSPVGTAFTPSAGLTGPFSSPTSIAVEAGNGAWIANQGGTSVVHVTSNRTVGSAVTCCNAPAGIALDVGGNVWTANLAGDSVAEIYPNGTIASAGYSIGTGTNPLGIALDGANHVWVANNLGNTIAELLGEVGTGMPGTLLSGASGYGSGASLKKPTRLAIDASGNLWVTSYGDNVSTGAVTEFVGAAAPVKTPLIGLPAKP